MEAFSVTFYTYGLNVVAQCPVEMMLFVREPDIELPIVRFMLRNLLLFVSNLFQHDLEIGYGRGVLRTRLKVLAELDSDRIRKRGDMPVDLQDILIKGDQPADALVGFQKGGRHHCLGPMLGYLLLFLVMGEGGAEGEAGGRVEGRRIQS